MVAKAGVQGQRLRDPPLILGEDTPLRHMNVINHASQVFVGAAVAIEGGIRGDGRDTSRQESIERPGAGQVRRGGSGEVGGVEHRIGRIHA